MTHPLAELSANAPTMKTVKKKMNRQRRKKIETKARSWARNRLKRSRKAFKRSNIKLGMLLRGAP